MGFAIEAGESGRVLDLSCDNFAWLTSCLDLPLDDDSWEPCVVMNKIAAFYCHVSGNRQGFIEFTDETTCNRIMDFLVPTQHPVLNIVLDAIGEGATVVEVEPIDWNNLGSLRAIGSPANVLWERLSGYMRDLNFLARYAQRNGWVLRVY